MNISIIRGDTAKFSFYRKDKDGHVILSQPEAIYFSVKNSPYESKTIIQKKLSDMDFDNETGKYTFYINPEDTNNLVYGTFDYDSIMMYGGRFYAKVSQQGYYAGQEISRKESLSQNDINFIKKLY